MANYPRGIDCLDAARFDLEEVVDCLEAAAKELPANGLGARLLGLLNNQKQALARARTLLEDFQKQWVVLSTQEREDSSK